jgi:hypothetical protein
MDFHGFLNFRLAIESRILDLSMVEKDFKISPLQDLRFKEFCEFGG